MNEKLSRKGNQALTVNCKSLDELPAMLTAAELAGALGISRAGAYTLIHRRDFPTLQIGKRLMVPKDKLLAWIDRQTAGDEGQG
mgnify:CR=1 FL=1